jgi:serine/threonine protein phosphatase 1
LRRTFVIADIHGCFKTLKALIEDQLQPTNEDQFIFLGDYIDRGPDSKSVINYLIYIKDTFKNSVFLRGNHEQMFLDAQLSVPAYDRWFYNGGREVLNSYGLKNQNAVPYHVHEFITNTFYYFQDEQYIFVHAGLNHLAEIPLKDYNSMMWIRDYEVNTQLTGGRIIIHGHTPTALKTIEEQIRNAKADLHICLDNGCVFKGQREGLGNLLALEIQSNTLFVQKNIDF